MISALVADMHLKPGEQPVQNKNLEQFLNRIISQKARRLILLGDTFNFWFERNGKIVGDYEEVLSIFKNASQAGLIIDLVSGNRDFAFARGVPDENGWYYPGYLRLIKNGGGLSKIVEGGIRPRGFNCFFRQDGQLIHCSHGDMYCTADVGHSMLRWWTMALHARIMASYFPFCVINLIIGFIQKRNAIPHLGIIPDTTAIQESALAPLVENGVDIFFCGHFHKPFHVRKIHGNNREALLYVLPCWVRNGNYVLLNNREVHLYGAEDGL